MGQAVADTICKPKKYEWERKLKLHLHIHNGFLLFVVVTFYKVSRNNELVNIESLLLGEIQG